MSSHEYNQLLKFLYFEGYADSYAEAEELLESMSDDEFEELLERKYDRDETLPSGRTPRQNMEKQRGRHGAIYMLRQRETRNRNDQAAGSHFGRASTMDTVKKAQDAGEEPRDNPAWKNTIAARRRERSPGEVPNERPGGLRAKNTTAAKVDDQGRVRSHRAVTRVNKEELEMQEAWYSGKGQYRTTASGRKVRWDEDEATDNAVSDMMQKRREATARKAAQARMKAKGKVPTKGGKPMFEEVVEYLFVEGYADTIEGAEEMAGNISENWVNEILDESRGGEASPGAPKSFHKLSRGEKAQKGIKTSYDNQGNMIRKYVTMQLQKRKEAPYNEEVELSNYDYHQLLKFLYFEGFADSYEEVENLLEDVTDEEFDEILEAAADQSDKQIDKGVKSTYKAGNVLDNLHQGRSKGINKLSATERDAKVKRMRERLKSRRDDLFKERGNREDAKRAELKKLLGL